MGTQPGVEVFGECFGARQQHGGHREAVDRAMVAVAGRSALGPEGKDDLRSLAAQKRDDLSDGDVGVRRGERSVRMPAMIDRGHSELGARLDQLRAADSSQFLTRRHGDAGRTSGIPVSGRIDRAANAFLGVLRQRSSRGEGLVVRMREDCRE